MVAALADVLDFNHFQLSDTRRRNCFAKKGMLKSGVIEFASMGVGDGGYLNI